MLVVVVAALAITLADYNQSPPWLPDAVLVRAAPLSEKTGGVSGQRLHYELIRRLESNELTGSALKVYLRRQFNVLNAQGKLIETRSNWPSDLPVRIRLPVLSDLWPSKELTIGHPTVLVAVLNGKPVAQLNMDARQYFLNGLHHPMFDWWDRTIQVPMGAIQSGKIILDYVVVYAESDYFDYVAQGLGDSQLIARYRCSTPVTLIAPSSECFRKVADEELAAPLSSVLSVNLSRTSEGSWELSVEIDEERVAEALAIGLSVGLVSEDDEVLLARMYCGDPRTPRTTNRFRVVLSRLANQSLDNAVKEADKFSIVFSGDRAMASRDFGKDQYWSGHFSVPLGDLRSVKLMLEQQRSILETRQDDL